MDSLTQTLEKLNINDEHHSGENLSNESDFLEETKEKIEKSFDFSNCNFYYGKRIMTLSVELGISPTAEIAHKILNNADEVLDVYFAKEKTLHEIGWCSSYMLDRRIL